MFTCSVGLAVTAHPFQEFAASLALATISASLAAGDEDGEVVITVTALDGGDATVVGDNAGVVTNIRWRTIDGIWYNLNQTTTGTYNIVLDAEYHGLDVNVWVQVMGTAGPGQTVGNLISIPGTHYETMRVIDGTDNVVDGTDQIVDEVAV